MLAARNGHETWLLARTPEEARALTFDRKNRRHRPELTFPENLRATADARSLAEATLVVLAVPSADLARNLDIVAPHLPAGASVLSAIKGIEPHSGRRMSELIQAAGVDAESVLVLSGPNFAAEIALGLPAASVIAGRAPERTQRAQALLTSSAFRVYTSDDLAGVEVGGALKNVVAIACGISDGLGMGANAKAALITRALAEITRLGVALGARPITFLGLSGIGDLIATCESDLSRNRRLGLAFAQGKTLDAALAEIEGVVEGAMTARAVRPLVQKAGVQMPISEELHAVLFEGKDPRSSLAELMTRAPRSELDGLA